MIKKFDCSNAQAVISILADLLKQESMFLSEAYIANKLPTAPISFRSNFNHIFMQITENLSYFEQKIELKYLIDSDLISPTLRVANDDDFNSELLGPYSSNNSKFNIINWVTVKFSNSKFIANFKTSNKFAISKSKITTSELMNAVILNNLVDLTSLSNPLRLHLINGMKLDSYLDLGSHFGISFQAYLAVNKYLLLLFQVEKQSIELLYSLFLECLRLLNTSGLYRECLIVIESLQKHLQQRVEAESTLLHRISAIKYVNLFN